MEIKCEFTYDQPEGCEFDFFGKYICLVSSASISGKSTKVKAFKGKHVEGRSDNDVDGIIFQNTQVNYIPRGLHSIFRRMTFLCVTHCGLKELKREDLRGLEKLKVLVIASNQFKSLPDNVFAKMSELEMVSFKDVRVTNNSRLLAALEHKNCPIRVIHFQDYVKIRSKSATGKDTVSREVTTKKDQNMTVLSEGFNDLWRSGLLVDFVIKVDLKEFRVHKNILALNSSVFSAMFDNAMSESQTNQMTMTDFDADSVHDFLNYLYTGQISDEDNAVELFSLAMKYDVEDLKVICEEIILYNLNESNAYEIYTLGQSHNSDKLKQEAFDEIVKMFPEKPPANYLINKPDVLKTMTDAKRKYDISVIETKQKYQRSLEKNKVCKGKLLYLTNALVDFSKKIVSEIFDILKRIVINKR